ncbi:MAG: tetratricopeptide repeat protein [Bacteroidales bacterium]|nr:tetratricopeptide repeat protein [Bacteroidales bacterium]
MEENNKKNTTDNELENESMLSKTEQFIDKNKKSITYIIGGLIVVVALFFIYKKSYLAPLEDEAHQEMFMAENYFAKDSFKLALNGDGQYPGFLTIIDEYSSTTAGNLANYYAGICYLRLGQFEKAIQYLEEYSTDDVLLYATKNGSIGDAYLELGKTDEAIKYYKKASYDKPNQFSSPFYLMKLGFAYEKLEQWDKALETYEYIEKQYNRTNEGRKVEKYITRVKIKLNKEDL